MTIFREGLNIGLRIPSKEGEAVRCFAMPPHRAKVGYSVRLRYGSLSHRTHPVNFLDNSLIEIMVGIGVVAVWMVGTTDLFQFSHTVGQVMYLGHPVTVFVHHALKLSLCAFACVI